MATAQQPTDFHRLLENAKVKINELVEKSPAIDEQVTKLAKKFNTEKSFVVLGFIALIFLGLLFLNSGDFAVDLVGFVYPVYASIKAIETEDNKEDDTFWLTYWLVFALFKVVENIADVLISSIPFYFFLKIGFLYCCVTWAPSRSRLSRLTTTPMNTRTEPAATTTTTREVREKL